MALSLAVRASSARSRRGFARCRRGAAVLLILGAASAGLAPAQAAVRPGWRIERYLPGAGVENGLILATGKSNAWTVVTGKLGSLDLARWNGSRWQPVPTPANLAGSGVTAEALAGSAANFVALGPADVWAIAAATPNPCGCVAEPAGLLLEHWNGHRWTATRLSKYAGVTGPVSDGHGGFWFASKRGSALLFVHVSNGKVTSTPVPRGHGESVGIDGLATIPGTRSIWAAGSLLVHHGQPQTWPVLKYGP